jgi:hypothetical protein
MRAQKTFYRCLVGLLVVILVILCIFVLLAVAVEPEGIMKEALSKSSGGEVYNEWYRSILRQRTSGYLFSGAILLLIAALDFWGLRKIGAKLKRIRETEI